jgi:hypothetical protein
MTLCAGMYGAQVPGGVPMQMYAQHPMTGAAGGGMMPGAMMAPGYPGAMPYGANQQQVGVCRHGYYGIDSRFCVYSFAVILRTVIVSHFFIALHVSVCVCMLLVALGSYGIRV